MGVLTENEVKRKIGKNKNNITEFYIEKGQIITPSAKSYLAERSIELKYVDKLSDVNNEPKEVVKEVLAELDSEGVAYAKDVEIGMMIEVPSAAVISDVLAKHVDFFSIGTNDLIQYTCAVDRMNQKISYLYNQFNPAVLRLIKTVIDNAHKEGKWAGMCGESAGDQKMIPILLGMGLDEFSMSPISILPARKLITSVKESDMKKLADDVLNMGTAEEIKSYIEKTFNI